MKKILIVEDEKNVRDLIEMCIEDLGQLLMAEDLAKAIELIDQHGDISIAILDGNVPGGVGLPNTQVLLPKLLAMGAVIIGMSADPDLNRILAEKGAHYPLGKPFKVDELRKIISSV